MDPKGTYDPSTLCIHADHGADDQHGALTTPIFQSSTFRFPSVEEGARRFAGGDGYIYTRLKNPTIVQLERVLASLEGGEVALGTATGMAAVTTMYFALLKAGDHVVGTDCMYGPSRIVMEREFSRFGIESDFVDTTDPAAVERAWRPNTRLLYVETPSNPSLKVTDLRWCAGFAHQRGALLAVDNTVLSPLLQRPLALGADVVVHSMTKFINGHSDVVAGAIVTREKVIGERIRKVLQSLGGTMDPHQAWLVIRGVRTLGLRVLKAQENGQAVARFLAEHPKVERVFYPGLPDHPGRALIGPQMKGPGSMISFVLRGGYAAGVNLLNSVRLCVLAVSLGSIETLIQHPASMTHSGMTPAERAEAGIAEGLVRLSVGCEEPADLIGDLREALEKC